MKKLKREFYEKNKNLYQSQYIKWDASKKTFVEANKKDFTVTIQKIIKIPDKKLDKLMETINLWGYEIEKIPIKDYGTQRNLAARNLYKLIVSNLNNCLSIPKQLINPKEKTSYFCCWIKNKDTYLSIGIFYVNEKEQTSIGMLSGSLAYPPSQTNKDERPSGTFGACGHNARITMINYIFKNKNVDEIYSEPINKNAEDGLKKLGFI